MGSLKAFAWVSRFALLARARQAVSSVVSLSMIVSVSFPAGLMAFPGVAFADSCSSTGSGTLSWNTSGNWTCGHVPTSSDAVTISSGDTVQINTTASAGSLAVNGTLRADGSARTLTVSGGVTVNSGGTLRGTDAGGSGTLTVNIAGALADSGTIRPGTQGDIDLVFNGSSAQTISGSPAQLEVNDFTLNNSNGVTLSTNLTVDGTFTFTNGKLATGSNQLNIANTSSSAVSGAGSSKYVYGTVQKSFANGSGQSFTFPVGDSSAYAPVAVSGVHYTSNSSNTISVKTTSGDHPNIATSGINSTVSVNRYWTLTQSGTISGTYTVAFNYLSSDVDSGTTPSAFVVKKYSSSTWSSVTVSGTPTNTLTTISGQSGSGDFAIGNTAPADNTAPSVSSSHLQSSNSNTALAKVGDTATFTFTASEAVRTPTVKIAGHTVTAATTTGNSFTTSYVMQSSDTEGSVPVYLSLTDLAGNAMATPATVTTDSSTVTFDKTAPALSGITSSQPNGSYKAGAVIPITVAFPEGVTTTGTPTLSLNSGGTAVFQSGAGNTLSFTYTVGAGENTADLDVTGVLLNGGSIKDAAGNDATFFPLPTGGSSLAGSTDIVIDTTAPTVTLSTPGLSSPTNHSPFSVTATFSEPISGFVLADDVTVGGVDGTVVNDLQTSDNKTFTFDVTPGAEGHVLLTVHAAAVSDVAGNLNAAGSNTLDITYDTTVPGLSITSGPTGPVNTDATTSNFAFTTDGTFVSCSIDGTATTTSCTSPFNAGLGGSVGSLTDGAHTFFVQAWDDASNTAIASQSFTVDKTAPTIDAMSDITATSTSPDGAIVNFAIPQGHDNIDASVNVTCDVSTSTALSIGNHTVNCNATDAAGNAASTTSFVIHVVDAGGSFDGVDGTQTTGTADNTYVHGWHWTLHFTVPFGETQFTMRWSDFTSGSDSVTADNIRFCSPQSDKDCSDDAHYVNLTASSTDSDSITFADTADTDTKTAGRQVDVRVEVKIPTTTPAGSYSATFDANSDAPVVLPPAND